MTRYRFGVALLVVALFAGQQTVQARLDGPTRTAAGYAVSLAFLAAVAELATLAVGRRVLASRDDRDVTIRAAWVAATLLLALDLFAKKLSAFVAVQRRPPPPWPTMGVVGGWVLVSGLARRVRSKRGIFVGASAALAAATGALVVLAAPFDRLPGDMLWVIRRALDAFFAGRFPYGDPPPPMPYLTGTFLAYAPPYALGLDLRTANLVLLAATVAASFGWPRRPGESDGALSPGQWLLPFFLLQPTWLYLEVNTQFAPSVLAAFLLGRAVARGGPWAQAAALGVAVGTNQMLGATAPILAAAWVSRHGVGRSIALASAALGIFLALVGPFLLWEPRTFVAVTLLFRGPLPPEVMSGRFTLLPMFVGVLPHASLVLTCVAIAAAAAWAGRARAGEGVVAAMAIGLGAVLLVQPASFSHYMMPVVALAAAAPAGPRPSAGPPHGPHRALRASPSAGATRADR